MRHLLKLSAAALILSGLSAAPTYAQSADVSPTLLIESGPSDNPQYRRMVFVKYLSGNYVSVNYRAYNRAEFTHVPSDTPQDIIAGCANGRATSLSDLKKFKRSEASKKRSGQAPEVTRFCIKNVPNWEGGGRDNYLNPIFDGMPYAATLNN